MAEELRYISFAQVSIDSIELNVKHKARAKKKCEYQKMSANRKRKDQVRTPLVQE